MGMYEGKPSAAVVCLHLQNIIKTITFLGLFPGFLQGNGKDLLQRFAEESQITCTFHPCWESPIHPRLGAAAQHPNSCLSPHSQASLPCLSPPPTPSRAAPSRNDCNGLARNASAVQVSNLLIRKALQDALEGIMSCQCRAIK